MLKKIQNEIKLTTLKCGIEYNEGSDLKQSEFSLLNVIGSLNVKRWNALKIAFACKTNENFVTKLLDIAQEYVSGKIIKEDDNQAHKGKKEINQIKTKKNKIVSILNKTQHEVHGNSFKKEKDQLGDSISENGNNNLPDNNVIDQINSEGKTECVISFAENIETQIDDVDTRRRNEFEESSRKNNTSLEKRNKKPGEHDVRKAPELDLKCGKLTEKEDDGTSNNLNIIKIKVCHYCSTCHIQDRCPINYPKYIINDAVDYKCWEEKFKLLYENQVNKIKNKKDLQYPKDKEKYSYSIISLPNSLYVEDTHTNHGLGVFAKDDIEQFSQFGPLTGKVIKEVDIPEDFSMRDLWEISSESGNIYINTECVELSNWLKYIRPAPKREARNVAVISKAKDLYFITVKFIKNGEELLYWQDNAVSTNKKKMEKTNKSWSIIGMQNPVDQSEEVQTEENEEEIVSSPALLLLDNEAINIRISLPIIDVESPPKSFEAACEIERMIRSEAGNEMYHQNILIYCITFWSTM